MSTWLDELAEDEDAPVYTPRRAKQDTELDMTPMIDCVFLLLIFFTVAATLDPSGAPDLPIARKGKGVDPDICVIVTIAAAEQGRGTVFLGDGTLGQPLTGTPETIRAQVRDALERGVLTENKKVLLIKADGQVAEREVLNVARAATELEGDPVPVAVGVMESE